MDFKDMIDNVRLPEFDFERRYFNIGEAHINGFELQAQKESAPLWAHFELYFPGSLERERKPTAALISKHNLNFDVQVFPLTGSSSWF